MSKNSITFIALTVLLALIIIYYPKGTLKPIASATYYCNEGKTMTADYYTGGVVEKEVVPGEPPVPTGSVELSLSDGRHFILPQTISASGIRYANEDESFVFWSKGDGALVLENNVEKSYIGCISAVSDPGGLPQVYADGVAGFSVRYPAKYSVDSDYHYQALGPGKDIYGVKFTIASSTTTGTNLSSFDTGVSVEMLPNTVACSAELFLGEGAEVSQVTDNDTEYSVGEFSGAGAGNFYEEKVWALPGTNPCVGVRYFIHSTNIHNYDPGTVAEFDRAALLSQFDAIRRTLTINQ